MIRYQCLLLFKNDLDKVFVISTDHINIVGILLLDVLVGLQGHLSERSWHLWISPVLLLFQLSLPVRLDQVSLRLVELGLLWRRASLWAIL